jgi:predicted outer membrane repeat protein
VNASNTLGGVIYSAGGVSLTLVGLNVSNISAKSGAAIYVTGVVVAINSSRFARLTATNGSGGALFFGGDSGFSIYGMDICVFMMVYL